ncbi:hypothetical protein AB0O07_16075 [Streptomyces sp. NPDC093085]|uniref:hypothetical protein n=1 Tax=Streptomyces sp. NPDC093085 TaxID=3155068 RepID=UPI003443E04F
MVDFGFTVTIDGREYPAEDLERYEYLRLIHMLHEFRQLDVDIRDGDRHLSHEDINWLEPADAKRIAIAARDTLGPDGIRDLFKERAANTDARWRAINEVPVEQQGVWLAQTDFAFRGLRLNPDLSWSLAGDPGGATTRPLMGRDPRGAIEVFPEHYAPAMETIGMYGEPVIAAPVPARDIPPYVPVTPDPDFPVMGVAHIHLADDNSDTHLGVIHQFKPLPDGYLQRSILFYPRNAPKILGDGHKIHFAVEMVNDARLAYERLRNA